MTRTDIDALLERHRDAFKRQDAEALAADFAETGVWKAPPTASSTGRARHSPTSTATGSPRFRTCRSPGMRRSIDGDRAAVFWKFAGTSHGPFFGIVGAGSRVELRGAAEYQFADGAIPRAPHLRLLQHAGEDRAC